MKKVIFSGIQPSGTLHIGNYIGAIEQWVKLQESSKWENELIFCVVDLHAVTVYQEPKILREKILELAALYIAAGIDPKKSHIFIQSENPDHSYLTWIFDCILKMGQLFRMTQFKEKAQKLLKSSGKSNAFEEARVLFEGPVGLFNYPALMAADILLYDTDLVPVGEDQVQHVELARDVAERFNRLYKTDVFKLPQVMLDKQAARVMSLQKPGSKMSKSEVDPLGTINLLDSTEAIYDKVKKAVTDSGKEIVYRPDKPAISNLLVIYSRLSGRSIGELEKQYQGKTYAQFKEDLAKVVDSALKPIREKYYELRREGDCLNKVLDEGRDFAISLSSKKVSQVKQVMGLGRVSV